MNMRKIAVAVAIMGANLATAAGSDEEAKQLGTTLTPFGAEKAASKDGSIPEYTGGLTTPPPGHKKRRGAPPRPLSDDKPPVTNPGKKRRPGPGRPSQAPS